MSEEKKKRNVLSGRQALEVDKVLRARFQEFIDAKDSPESAAAKVTQQVGFLVTEHNLTNRAELLETPLKLKKVRKPRGKVAVLTETVTKLQAKLEALEGSTTEQVAKCRAELAALQKRVEELEKLKMTPETRIPARSSGPVPVPAAVAGGQRQPAASAKG